MRASQQHIDSLNMPINFGSDSSDNHQTYGSARPQPPADAQANPFFNQQCVGRPLDQQKA